MRPSSHFERKQTLLWLTLLLRQTFNQIAKLSGAITARYRQFFPFRQGISQCPAKRLKHLQLGIKFTQAFFSKLGYNTATDRTRFLKSQNLPDFFQCEANGLGFLDELNATQGFWRIQAIIRGRTLRLWQQAKPLIIMQGLNADANLRGKFANFH